MAPLLLYSPPPANPVLRRDMKLPLQGGQALRRTWRVFSTRDGRRIDYRVRMGQTPLCPCCGAILEARQQSRLHRKLPLDAVAVDLDCRGCRRFWSIVQHTERSLQLMRMRRFVAALRAVEVEPAATVTATA
jgi:hypothetical protein